MVHGATPPGRTVDLHQVQEFVNFLESQTSRKVKILGLDCGPEFGLSTKELQNSKLATWAHARGLEIYKTTPHTPWMNGKIERAGRVMMEYSRAVMIEHKIPRYLWPFVVENIVSRFSTYCQQEPTHTTRAPHEVFSRAVNMPEEARKPYLKHLRSYFCPTYYYIKPQKRVQSDKWSQRCKKGFSNRLWGISMAVSTTSGTQTTTR